MSKVELTRVLTVEVTAIRKLNGKEDALSKEEAAEAIKNKIKEAFVVDDVLVTNVQDFVRDIAKAE